MQLKAKIEMPKLHNYFNIKVIDTETGDNFTTPNIYNVVLDQCYDLIISNNSDVFNVMHFGKGTGPITKERTGLFSPISYKTVTKDSIIITDDLVTVTGKITFSESEQIGMVITEIGLGNGNKLWTHALLQDSEGNPISIGPKTDTQRIEIYYTLYIERGVGMSKFPNRFSDKFTTSSSSEFLISNTDIYTLPVKAYFSRSVSYDPETKTVTTPIKRIATNEANTMSDFLYDTTDIRGIGVSFMDSPVITFPNHEVFPPFTFSERTIGVGDGANRFFNLDSGFFIDGSEAIKVNGAIQVKDVDYKAVQGGRQRLNIEDAPCPYNADLVPDCYTCNSDRSNRVFQAKVYDKSFAAWLHRPNLLLDFGRVVNIPDMFLFMNSTGVNLNVSYSEDDLTWSSPVQIKFTGNNELLTALRGIETRYVHLNVATSQIRPIIHIYGAPSIQFVNPPATGAIVTATWRTEIPPKNANLFYDAQVAIKASW